MTATLVDLQYTTITTPIGHLLLVAAENGLAGVYMENHRRGPAWPDAAHQCGDHAVLRDASRQLREYFAGRRASFDLPLALAGTEFQRRVWRALLDIPIGTTTTYAHLAQRISQARAVRAVGAAVGRNPLSIIVPCHRVVGTSGSRTGFAGGLERKGWLLAHERDATAAP